MRNQRGVFLLMSIGVVIFFSIVGAGSMARSTHETSLGRRSAARQSAFYLAEAGIDRASWNLRTPTDATDDLLGKTLPTGTFAIDLQQEVSPLIWRVGAHGTSAQERRDMEAIFQLTPQPIWRDGLHGELSVIVSGDVQTDSYDSQLGAYGGSNVGQQGNIGTNSTAAGSIDLSGGDYFIDGQIAVGPNLSDPYSAVSCTISGPCTAAALDPYVTADPPVVSAPAIPFPPMPAPVACNNSTLPPKVANVRTFSAGTYCLVGNQSVEKEEVWTTNGLVTIYITGTLSIAGGATVGNVTDPTRMLFVLNQTAQIGSLTGQAKFYGMLYGPDANVKISGDAQIFGAIAAERVTIEGHAQLHYDVAVMNDTRVVGEYRRTLLSWREL